MAAAILALWLAALPALGNNNGLQFEGVGDYADGTNLPTAMTTVTLEAWVYHNQITNRVERYVTVGSEVAVLRMDGASSPGQLHFYIKTSGTLRHLRVNDAITNDGWHPEQPRPGYSPVRAQFLPCSWRKIRRQQTFTPVGPFYRMGVPLP